MASTRGFLCLYVVCICSGIEARSTSQLPTESTQVPTSQEPLVGSSVSNGSPVMTESPVANGSSVMPESPVANGSSVMTASPLANGSSVMTESPVANGSSVMTESPVANGSSVMTESPVANGSSVMTESPVTNGSSVMTESPVANGSSVMTESPVANGSSVMTESPVANGSSVMTDSSVSTGSSVTTESFLTSNDTMSSDHTGSYTMSSYSSSPMSSDRSPQPASSSPNPTTQAQQTTTATSTTSPMPVPHSSPTTAGVTPGPADTSYFNIVVSVAIIGGVLAFLTIATICIYVCFLQPRKKQSASLEEKATTKKKKKRKKTSLREADVSELIVAIDKQSKPLEMDSFDNNSSDGDTETVQVHKENTEMQNGVEHRRDPEAGGGTQPSKKMDSGDTNNVRISIHRELLEMTKRRSIKQESGETNRQMSTFGKAGGLDRSASTVSSISLQGITGVGGQGITDNPWDKAGGGQQDVGGNTTKELVRQDAISSDLSAENAVPEPRHSEAELKADSQQEVGGTKQLVRQNSVTEDSVSEGSRSESETKADTQQEDGDTNDQKSISSTDDNKPEDGHSESELHSDSQDDEGQTKQLASQTANDFVPDTEDSVAESDPEMQAVNNAGSGHVQEPDNSGTKNHGLGQPKYSEESYSQAYECEVYEEDDLESVDEGGQLADGDMQMDPDDGRGQRHIDIDAMIRERVGDGLSNIIMSTRL
ncbi:endochitinase A-like [Haliotis rubra]|uniref:endochitinase A-like n=1 Tax=Haliotis rubra TaxID=36100 RepID=UPI001EE5EE07|nr:endochitinase A-like [Haliotis rubra]